MRHEKILRAAVRAGVGQLVEWWRERSRVGVDNRRRAEDRQVDLNRELRSNQRDTYLDIIGKFIDLRIYTDGFCKQL
jgi:hypothetical protein